MERQAAYLTLLLRSGKARCILAASIGEPILQMRGETGSVGASTAPSKTAVPGMSNQKHNSLKSAMANTNRHGDK